MEYWGVSLRPGRSSGIDFAFPADFLSLPAATFKADNALAAVEQHGAKLLWAVSGMNTDLPWQKNRDTNT